MLYEMYVKWGLNLNTPSPNFFLNSQYLVHVWNINKNNSTIRLKGENEEVRHIDYQLTGLK